LVRKGRVSTQPPRGSEGKRRREITKKKAHSERKMKKKIPANPASPGFQKIKKKKPMKRSKNLGGLEDVRFLTIAGTRRPGEAFGGKKT